MPIIMVTAKGEEIDRVVGLEVGADDYIVKPFGFRELIARIRAVTRRTASRAPRSAVELGPLVVDTRSRRVTVDGNEVDLSPKEFDLLALLASDPGAVVSRRRILEEVWETTWFGSSKTIDVHMAALRRKLGDPAWIETVRGVGFRLHVPVSRRFLVTYIALAAVVLASLEIPLGIQYGRSERSDLDGTDRAGRADDGHLRRGHARARPDQAPVRPRPRREELPALPGRPRRHRRRDTASRCSTRSRPSRAGARSRPVPSSPPPCSGRIATGIRHSNTLKTDLMYVAVPIASGGVIRGAVRITYPTATLDARVSTATGSCSARSAASCWPRRPSSACCSRAR